MSEAPKYTPSPAFDRAAHGLDLAAEPFWFNREPAEQAELLQARIKFAAKLLAKAADISHSSALDAMAQALRFPSWHHLSAHLGRAADVAPGPLPAGWLDALSTAVVLTARAETEVTMPSAQLDAFEALGETLAMLTDAPKQKVLDQVSAGLCAGRSWREVRQRSPLDASAPLYRFAVHEQDAEGSLGGSFEESPACHQLVEQLDDNWQGYDGFTKAQKKRARGWVEAALAMQPGFLEANLALAWMQKEAGEPQALTTANAAVRQAEALIPRGFKGRILWGHLGNRFYHRLLWLQLRLHHEQGASNAAVRVARKILRLNPNDNLGVRYVLPFLLLEQGEVAAARRSLKAISDEVGLTAAATRAFVAYAEDKPAEFRRELATALFTLPVLRAFLLNDNKALPEGESGYRHVRPDMETFAELAWPSYCMLPGLRKACQVFLAEPEVQAAERELAVYWTGYWEVRRTPGAERKGSAEGWARLLALSIDKVGPRPRRV